MTQKIKDRDRTTQALTIEAVKELGRMLIEVGAQYPLRYVTEMDHYPLVIAYLHGRAPLAKPEVRQTNNPGRIDFRVGGRNPVNLELAMTSRNLADLDDPDLKGPRTSSQLYPSENASELRKLSQFKPSESRANFLLLVDNQNERHDVKDLERLYKEWVQKDKVKKELGDAPVRVVYVPRVGEAYDFLVRKR